MKVFRKLLSVLLLMMMLTGCCKIEAVININNHSEIVTNVTVTLNKNTLQQLEMHIEDIIDKLYEYDPELVVDSYQVENIDNNMQSINFVISNSSFISTDIENDTCNVDINISKLFSTKILDGKDISILKEAGLKAELKLNMPGSITSSNYGVIKGKRLMVDLLELDEELIVSSNVGVPMDYGLLSTTLFLLIITIFITLLNDYQKDKNKSYRLS